MRTRPAAILVASATAFALILGSNPALASSVTQDAAAAAPIAVQAAAVPPETNEIVLENRKGGTTAWRLPWNGYNMANDNNLEIKGYASDASVNRGETVGIRALAASTGTASYGVYRLGWYQGLGGRTMASGTFQAGSQPGRACTLDGTTGLIECPWNDSFTIETKYADGEPWPTGIYVVTLTKGTWQNYASFVVRDDAKKNAIVHLQSALTSQAYNNFPDNGWTGKSLYPYNSYGANTIGGDTRAVKVSFDRPYSMSGAAFVMTDDAPMIRYAESRGFDMKYTTDTDLHNRPDLLTGQIGMVSVGHDEYWTGAMFTAAEKARDAGVDLAYFGANNVYWQTRMEPSTFSGDGDRVMVVYRDPTIDPVQGADASVRFRYLDTPRPEQTLMGQMWDEGIGMTLGDWPWTVSQADHWFYRGTGLGNGSEIPMLVGIEVDRRLPYYPEPARLAGTSTAVLASSYYTERLEPYRWVGPQEATLYQAPSQAYVFSAGTLRYPRGLYGDGPAAQQSVRSMTTNLFAKFQGLAENAATKRVGGDDRYSTAVGLSQHAFPDPDDVPVAYLATGANYPDALAAAAATQGDGPVLLVPGASIPQAVLDELARLTPTKLEVVGGSSVVSDAVMQQASAAAGVTAVRRSGADRYETAAALSANTFGPGVPVAYVATGANFPDALAAGAAGAQLGGPVLLTAGTALPPSTRAELERLKPARIVVVGGDGVVSNGVLSALDQLAPQTVRLAGADRYETALAVARALGAPSSAHTVGLATALNFPDALAAGPAVAAAGGSLLLVSSTLSPAVAEELRRADPSLVLLAGSSGAIPNTVMNQVGALFQPATTGTEPEPLAPQRRAAPPAPPEPVDTWKIEPYDQQELPWVELPTDEWQYDPGSE
ncbi:cell wall-binding repeat-containing protein [Agromyces sp. Marseille-P2726]|uniref:cell wall-binding repeat-containing protein n=1 Tax=Agromyces sp. Marseille-P2726 TaxID=2709132 RepID=UPI00156F9A0D|nr:cell wall-binding repeat-containing protein [Agromyces sp. Marseille-P2726]